MRMVEDMLSVEATLKAIRELAADELATVEAEKARDKMCSIARILKYREKGESERKIREMGSKDGS